MAESEMDRIRRIFDEVVETTGEERERQLARLCGDDDDLRARVEALLAAHERSDDALDSPTIAGANAAAAAVLDQLADFAPEPGTRIGPYKLLERIGEGGFGVVYVAEQMEPIRRRVALKIIKPGMDTKQVIARFEAERQALAMLDHPGITRVYDAGATEAGRPYFVMELVRGVPIDEYCDANRLNTRDRLRLFRDVCSAIEHAHKKGIVHRDIKPSNILVTLHDGEPTPKIIDFGVAKATHQPLTEKTLYTLFNQFIGTPVYMSPEQALGGTEVDARSDIYSLGVLLYELLTGTTPFDSGSLRKAAYLEIVRVLSEDDPPTPSTRVSTMGDAATTIAKLRQSEAGALAKLLRRDLDWIVMKALEKNPTRRYASAASFAEDITRYFEEEPISARSPSTVYRVQKFARRRRRPIAAAALIAATATIATTAASWRQGAALRGAAAAESSSPVRRLVLDHLVETPGWPVRDGGEYLRYDTVRGGFELLDLASRRTTQLTRAGRSDLVVRSAQLTPDRARIAAILHSEDAGGSLGPLELRVFDVDAAGDGRLLRSWELGHHVQVFGWNAGHERIWVFVIRPDRQAQIASVNVTDGAFEVLRTLAWRNHSQKPSLSPDGRFIAYHDSEPRGPADVYIIATGGTRPIRLEHAGNDTKPVFVPDGSGIVFVSNRRNASVRDLWFQPLIDGRPAGEPRLIYGDVAPLGTIDAFAENGTLYYFFASTRWEIFTARIPGDGGVTVPEHLTPRSGEMNNGPSFSPDGLYMAHVRDRGRRLVIRELSNGAEREIPLPTSSIVPTTDWCGDGSAVLVWTADKVVHRVDIQRARIERLALVDPLRVGCIDNGRSIIYSAGSLIPGESIRIARRDLETGAETELYSGRTIPHVLQSSADETRIGFIALDGDSARIVIMPSTGGVPTFTMPVTLQRDRGTGRELVDSDFMFDPAGDGIIVLRNVPGAGPDDLPTERTILRVPFDGTGERELGTLELPEFADSWFGSMSYAMHPDGRTFAFERHAGTAVQDWAIENLLRFIQSGESWTPDRPVLPR